MAENRLARGADDGYTEFDEHDDSYGECYVPGVYSDCGAQDQDYGEYPEIEPYTEYTEFDEYDDKYGECYVPGVYSDCGAQDQDYGEHTDTSGGGGGGSNPEGKYKILDVVNSQTAPDNITFTYIIEDREHKTLIASTNQEEYFVQIKTSAGYQKINGEYYVTSASSITVIFVVRVIDYMREQYPAAEDVYYSSAFNGVLALYNGVALYTQPNQITCKGMTYVTQPSTGYIQIFVRVKSVIERKAGKILDVLYDSDTDRTIVKCVGEKIYRADVENAVFYKDERYALSETYINIVLLRPAIQMIMEQFHVAQADIVVHSDRITFTTDNGAMYKVFFNNLPDYYEYDYDYYVPSNATIIAEVDYADAPAIPTNYVRVVKEIQRITGVTAVSQDDNYLIEFYGKQIYIPGAVRFGGWLYASPKMVVSALTSNFVDINDYLHSCGFYYGTDDDGNSYDAFVYKSQTTWLLGKVITIADRFRVNSSYGYYNLTSSTEMIENAVKAVFGFPAQYVGKSALESKTLKSYFESDLYIQKARIRTEGGYLSINGKSFLISNVQRKFGGSAYYDKTKLLTAVESLTPEIGINEIVSVLPDGEEYAYIAGNKVKLTINPRQLDHFAVGVMVNGTTKWYENSLENVGYQDIVMEIPLLQPGDCTLKFRGRTTMDPAVVGKDIPHSKEVESQRELTVLAAIPDDCVYIEPYAKVNKCTTELYADYLKVFFQHRNYSQPEKCTYYKSKANPGPYERVCSYTNDGLYIEKNIFRMDMDFDIETDPHKNRDWYLKKRVWRLLSQGKVASFSEEKTESGTQRGVGKKYHDVVLNNVSRKIYKIPEENAFYEGPVSRDAGDERASIRIVNGEICMEDDTMGCLYKYKTPVRDYIESHYKMYNPTENLFGSGQSITLFKKPLEISCIINNETWKNNSSPEEIKKGMDAYFSTYLKNVYDSLPEKLRSLFQYEAGKNGELGKISFDGFKVGLPETLITRSTEEVNPENYANTTEYAKDALYATQADINRICRYRRIVVYGGGFGGFCAAYNAAQYAWSLGEDFMNFEIFLINPVPTPKLGGIGTVGGQNFWDTRDWNGKFPYRGTLKTLMDFKNGELSEDRYNTDKKAEQMKEQLAHYGVNVFFQEDITHVEQATDGKITSVTVRRIERNSNDDVVYVGGDVVIHGDVFIDASEDGKLTRFAAKDRNGRSAVTKGRYDYPAQIVAEDGTGPNVKQPAVSLMFKLKTTGISPTESNVDIRYVDNDDSKEINCFNCGRESFSISGTKLHTFNEKYKNTRFLIKPVNSAWNGGEELYEKDANGQTKRYTTWWLNSLLIFGVDGTLHKRDMTSADASSGYLSTDEAWKQARQFLEEHSNELIEVYRSLGYKDADFVRDNQGKIVTGDILYVRETIHTAKDTNAIANGTENQNYEVTRDHCHYAAKIEDDPVNPQSIGLVYYNSDIHPFKKEDCLDNNGNYIWGGKSFAKIRWDMNDNEYILDGNSPSEPTYIPYKALTTQYVPNLLIPGYSVSAGSFAWSEIRVFPNLCVLGDAAGIAAVTSLLSGDAVCNLSDVQGVRTILRQYDAILDKSEV